MSDKPKTPYRDPKYSGWPGPQSVLNPAPSQVDLEEVIPAPKPKTKKSSATGAGAGE